MFASLSGILPNPWTMARPKKNLEELRAIQINIRYTVKEYLIVSDNANTSGISITDYIRRKTTGSVLPRKKVAPEDRKLFITLGRLGNNINQLTRKVHSNKHYPKQLKEELKSVKNLLESLMLKLVQNDS